MPLGLARLSGGGNGAGGHGRSSKPKSRFSMNKHYAELATQIEGMDMFSKATARNNRDSHSATDTPWGPRGDDQPKERYVATEAASRVGGGDGRVTEGGASREGWGSDPTTRLRSSNIVDRGGRKEGATNREDWETETASRLGSRFRYDPDRHTQPHQSSSSIPQPRASTIDPVPPRMGLRQTVDPGHEGFMGVGRSKQEGREIIADLIQTASLPSGRTDQKLPSWIDTVIFPSPPTLAPPALPNQHSSSDELVLTPERQSTYRQDPQNYSYPIANKVSVQQYDPSMSAHSPRDASMAASHQGPMRGSPHTDHLERNIHDPFQAPLMSARAQDEGFYYDEPFASHIIAPALYDSSGTARPHTYAERQPSSHTHSTQVREQQPGYGTRHTGLPYLGADPPSTARRSLNRLEPQLGPFHAAGYHTHVPHSAPNHLNPYNYGPDTPYHSHQPFPHHEHPYRVHPHEIEPFKPYAPYSHSYPYHVRHPGEALLPLRRTTEPRQKGWYYFGDHPPQSPPPVISHHPHRQYEPRHMQHRHDDSSASHGQLASVNSPHEHTAAAHHLPSLIPPHGTNTPGERRTEVRRGHPATTFNTGASSNEDIPASLTAVHAQIQAARRDAPQLHEPEPLVHTEDTVDPTESSVGVSPQMMDIRDECGGREGEEEAEEDWNTFVRRKKAEAAQGAPREGRERRVKDAQEGARLARDGELGERGFLDEAEDILLAETGSAPAPPYRNGPSDRREESPPGGSSEKKRKTNRQTAADGARVLFSENPTTKPPGHVRPLRKASKSSRAVETRPSLHAAAPASSAFRRNQLPFRNLAGQEQDDTPTKSSKKRKASNMLDMHDEMLSAAGSKRHEMSKVNRTRSASDSAEKQRLPRHEPAMIAESHSRLHTSTSTQQSSALHFTAPQVSTNANLRPRTDDPTDGHQIDSIAVDDLDPITPIRSALKQPSSSQERAHKRARRTRFDLPDLTDDELQGLGDVLGSAEAGESEEEEEPAYTPSRRGRPASEQHRSLLPSKRSRSGLSIAPSDVASGQPGRLKMHPGPAKSASVPPPRRTTTSGGSQRHNAAPGQQVRQVPQSAVDGPEDAPLDHSEISTIDTSEYDVARTRLTAQPVQRLRHGGRDSGASRQGHERQARISGNHDEADEDDEDEYSSDDSESCSSASSPPAHAYMRLTDGAQVGYALPPGTVPALPFKPSKPRRQPGLVPRSGFRLDGGHAGAEAYQRDYTAIQPLSRRDVEIPFVPIDQRPRNAHGQFLPYATIRSPIERNDDSDDDEVREEIDEFPSQSQTLSNTVSPSPPPPNTRHTGSRHEALVTREQGYGSGSQQIQDNLQKSGGRATQDQAQTYGAALGQGRGSRARLDVQLLSPFCEEDEEEGEEDDELDEDEVDERDDSGEGHPSRCERPAGENDVSRSIRAPTNTLTQLTSRLSSKASTSNAKTSSKTRRHSPSKQNTSSQQRTMGSNQSPHRREKLVAESSNDAGNPPFVGSIGRSHLKSNGHIDQYLVDTHENSNSNINGDSSSTSNSKSDGAQEGNGPGEGFFGPADGDDFSIWRDHY